MLVTDSLPLADSSCKRQPLMVNGTHDDFKHVCSCYSRYGRDQIEDPQRKRHPRYCCTVLEEEPDMLRPLRYWNKRMDFLP